MPSSQLFEPSAYSEQKIQADSPTKVVGHGAEAAQVFFTQFETSVRDQTPEVHVLETVPLAYITGSMAVHCTLDTVVPVAVTGKSESCLHEVAVSS
jgi:hypothetical protein